MNNKFLLKLALGISCLICAYALVGNHAFRFNFSQDNNPNSLDGAHGKPGYGFEDGENGQDGKNSNGHGDGGKGGNGGSSELGKGGNGGNGGDG